ncbi:MAG: alcohol dehydrogenase catalytic domain-containing protein [Myxococcota bacterium]
MKGLVYHGHEDVRFESAPDPKIEDAHDVVVRIEKTAICGSDLHFWHGEAIAGLPPFLLGHEFAGVVEDAGSAVERFRKGDRVLVSCTVGCGRCDECRDHRYGGCSTLTGGIPYSNVFGNPLRQGGQAEAARVPFADANLFRVPDGMDYERGLFLTDVLPTGYMGAELAEVGPGDVVVVFGCGPVGTFAQRGAQLRGASQVFAVDLDDARLARARARGCTPVNPRTQDVKETVREATRGRGADCAIEAIGLPSLVAQAIDVVRFGGRVAVIGVMPAGDVALPWTTGVMGRNLTLRSALVEPQNYVPKLLPLIEQGRLDPTEIITHRLPLADGARGYEIFAAHDEDALKVVLTP